MNKVHMGKNKSLVISDSTKLILNQLCHGLCESGRNCIIKRLNFIIKILYGVRILVKQIFNEFHISLTSGV